jgi:pentose-5-phosphate-3-epimerase
MFSIQGTHICVATNILIHLMLPKPQDIHTQCKNSHVMITAHFEKFQHFFFTEVEEIQNLKPTN